MLKDPSEIFELIEVDKICFIFNIHFQLYLDRQSSNSSRKYSQDETSAKHGNTKQFKKSRKAKLQSKVCLFFF